MIPKITKGNGFRGIHDYASKGPLLETNVNSADPGEIARQMRKVADSSTTQTGKPVYHVSLRPSEEDWNSGKLSEADLRGIAHDWCSKMGIDLEKHQYAMYSHKAFTSAGHIHLIINKVGMDGVQFRDLNDFARGKAACREIEIERGLRVVPNDPAPEDEGKTKLNGKEKRKWKRTGMVPPKEKIKRAIDKRSPKCHSLEELRDALRRDGVSLEILTNKSGPYGVKFSTADEKGKMIYFTGQQVAKSCTISKLKKRLGNNMSERTDTSARVDNEFLELPDVGENFLRDVKNFQKTDQVRRERTQAEASWRRMTRNATTAIAAAFAQSQDGDEDEDNTYRHRPGM